MPGCARGVATANKRKGAAARPGPANKEGAAGPGQLTASARGPRATETAPPMSGTPYPPTDLLRSTFGEEGLNFRVRNGIG